VCCALEARFSHPDRPRLPCRLPYGASSTITTGSLQLRSQGVVDIFTLYRVSGSRSNSLHPPVELSPTNLGYTEIVLDMANVFLYNDNTRQTFSKQNHNPKHRRE
jgi:hypothetical protein